jgi:hypothetical protein
MGESNLLFESLFKRNITAADNAEFLLQLTKEHPYFAAAQFYLLQQTAEDAITYNKEAAKTLLLFNNTYWLNFQLSLAKKEEEQNHNDATEIADASSQITNSGNHFNNSHLQTEPQPFDGEYDDNEEGEDESMLPEIEPLHINLKMDAVAQNTTEEDPLLFQPLFTRDYFASQGIKLSDDVLPTDKLGANLKSFTSWLKTMKKIHNGPHLPEGNENAENAVQKMAERSNDKQEILTETMAEVLIQQNRKDLAINLYRKLSLLDPAKSTYFAAKIEHLKE